MDAESKYRTEDYKLFDDVASRGHWFEVPLNYQSPDGEKITVYGHEVVEKYKRESDLPWFLYLQGGPGA